MARRRFQLIQEQVEELTYAYTCCKDGPTRTRYQAVRLYRTGYPVEEIERKTLARSSLQIIGVVQLKPGDERGA